MKKILLSATLLIFSSTLYAQEPKSVEDFQIAFISPISTNGMDSWQTANRYSVNLLGGLSYANEEFEFGGLYNINQMYASGFQFAGLFNLTQELDDVTQFAGLFNLSGGGETPFQFAGLFNAIADYNILTVNGAQLAGVANVANFVEGAQLSGVTNATQEMSGVQASGIFNYTEVIEGAQLAGISNYSEDIEGAQLSGIFNYAESVDGAQLSLINYAESVEGLQLGLINISDDTDGVHIGLINIVGGGKSEVEIAFSDVLTTALSYRFGTNIFYTIVSAGANYTKPIVDYGAGLGFGSDIAWRGRWGNQIEGYIYALTEHGEFQKYINLMAQLRYTVSVELGSVELFAGPTASLTISDIRNPYPSTIQPWSQSQWSSGNSLMNLSVGFSAGIRFL